MYMDFGGRKKKENVIKEKKFVEVEGDSRKQKNDQIISLKFHFSITSRLIVTILRLPMSACMKKLFTFLASPMDSI